MTAPAENIQLQREDFFMAVFITLDVVLVVDFFTTFCCAFEQEEPSVVRSAMTSLYLLTMPMKISVAAGQTSLSMLRTSLTILARLQTPPAALVPGRSMRTRWPCNEDVAVNAASSPVAGT